MSVCPTRFLVAVLGMLHGKLRLSEHAHARVLAVDTSEAERMPGVQAVLTAWNTPEYRFGSDFADQTLFARHKVLHRGSVKFSPARTRISLALSAGRIVMVPNQTVNIGGAPRIAWLEIQPDGILVDVLENGGYQAIVEYSANYSRQAAQRAAEREITNFFIGFFTGWIAGQLVFLIGYSISGLKVNPDFPEFASITATSLYDQILTEVFARAIITDPIIFAGFQAGLQASSVAWLTIGVFDPPLPSPVARCPTPEPPPPCAWMWPALRMPVSPLASPRTSPSLRYTV